jgi:hypothetical protein
MPVGEVSGEASPEIALRQVTTERDGVRACWSIAWVVENKSANMLQIVAVRLPHGQFKSDEHRFEPALHLAAGASSQFQLCVSCSEPAGLVTENGFVIFTVRWSGEEWRIFVRIRVAVNSEGKPETATELITSQKIGFSRLPS